jgi:hypothetical protein
MTAFPGGTGDLGIEVPGAAFNRCMNSTREQPGDSAGE